MSRFSLRAQRTALTLSLATAAALVPATAFAVGPESTPGITAPSDGAVLTDPDVTVSATSAAYGVRFVIDGRTGAAAYDQLVTVSGGSASAQFSLLGLSGPTQVTAMDCDDQGVCDTGGASSVSVDVELDDPVITSPTNDEVVGTSVNVSVDAPGPSVEFFLDGSSVGQDATAPIEKNVSLSAVNDGTHTISVRQCNVAGTVCNGGEASVDVVKDTRGPRWTDVSTSRRTFYPARDHYKDSTVLSARASERVTGAKVEIRKAGGPLVRTLPLGRVDAGKVRTTWNGRKSNGDVAPRGRYQFRFVGTDANGIAGESRNKSVLVSDKRLVSQTVTRTVSAKGSFVTNGSGACSGVYRLDYPQRRYDWPHGAGYYSQSKCVGGGDADVAIALHRAAVPKAIRYGTMRIDTYGAGAFRNPGPGAIVYVKANNTAGAGRVTSASLGWHRGPSADGDKYVRSGRVSWVFGTASGNWFDVKEYRITLRVMVLR